MRRITNSRHLGHGAAPPHVVLPVTDPSQLVRVSSSESAHPSRPPYKSSRRATQSRTGDARAVCVCVCARARVCACVCVYITTRKAAETISESNDSRSGPASCCGKSHPSQHGRPGHTRVRRQPARVIDGRPGPYPSRITAGPGQIRRSATRSRPAGVRPAVTNRSRRARRP